MAKQIIVLEETSRSCRVLKLLKLNLSGLSIVELIVVACLEVHTDDRVRVERQVDSKNLETHIVVVHLVVAESNVDIDGVEVFIFD